MKVVFLGTGTSQGVPVVACSCKVCQSNDPKDKRLRSSVLIEKGGVNLVIDSGPDFRYQMLREKVTHLEAILFTHEHKDHTGGLDDIRSFNYLSKKPMDVYAEERVQQSLKREYAYIFENNKYPGVPEVTLHTISNQPFEVAGIRVIPIRLLHHRLPILGFRIDNFAYLTDIKYISQEEKEKLLGCRYLVVSGLRKENHISHFSIDEAIDLIREIRPEYGYITHISHQLGFHREVEKELPKGIYLAYDRLVLDCDL
ncbi:MAG TPA: MBL fold metallo-hydrolase [Bacteroidales bacterium]|nr:MBL fold metallo-hydrolase [Bacteroidales bacterium]HOK98982.1 MBL fold metallo-hydrolase [Bacteroidales bacterium]HPO65815.1 MBL fold metallo-hydrolase [Bacteroidales bacterium]